jgi:cytochrome oxidase assembly protein ShyY1
VRLLERRWVAGHLLALVMAALFVGLGIWQLARNDEKHRLVERAKAAYAKPAPDLTTLGTGAPDGTRIEARGTFDGAHETVLRNQVRGDHVGVDVLTPLRLANGSAVLVDRGWVRASARGGLSTDRPPGGTTVVRGLLHASNPLKTDDSVDELGAGRLGVPRVDLDAIGRTLPYRLQPRWIEAQAIDPKPTGGAPQLPQPPAPDPVNHLHYAIEWFGLALIPIVGWPIALRRFLRQRNAATSPSSESTASTEAVTSRSGRVGSRERNP